MTAWLVAQTESQREHVAVRWLKEQRFEPYLPQIRVRRYAAGRVIDGLAPPFPSYLFIRGTDLWQPIVRTVGIIDLLYSGDTPAQLTEAVIDRIRAQEQAGVVQLPSPPLRRGDQVRLIGGVFGGHLGVYDGMLPHQRVAIMLTFLGSQRRVELGRRDIVRV